MLDRVFYVRAFSWSLTLALLVAASVACQKPMSEKTEDAGSAAFAKSPMSDSGMTAGRTMMTDSAVPNRDTMGVSTPEGYYTCSMHPQVHQAKPGTCPICGMTLIHKKPDMATEKKK